MLTGLASPGELIKEIGQRVRARRLALTMRHEDVAAASGVPVRTLRRLERDGKGTLETAVRVAIALGAEEPLHHLFPAPEQVSLDEIVRSHRQRQRGKRTT